MAITALQMGEIIRNARRQSGLTQGDLSQIIGVSIQAVSKWETGGSFPDITLLPRLAEALSLSISALFGQSSTTPFPDDGKLRIVQYLGQYLMHADEVTDATAITLNCPPQT